MLIREDDLTGGEIARLLHEHLDLFDNRTSLLLARSRFIPGSDLRYGCAAGELDKCNRLIFAQPRETGRGIPPATRRPRDSPSGLGTGTRMSLRTGVPCMISGSICTASGRSHPFLREGPWSWRLWSLRSVRKACRPPSVYPRRDGLGLTDPSSEARNRDGASRTVSRPLERLVGRRHSSGSARLVCQSSRISIVSDSSATE